MSNDIPSERLVTARADELPARTPEDLERLRRLEEMSDEEVARRAESDPDSPAALNEQRAGTKRVVARLMRIEMDLLAWLDRQPRPMSLVNDLLRRCRAEQEEAGADAIADELEAIAGRLRSSGRREAV